MKRLLPYTLRARRAFTLVEIMIVVAIIALIAAIALPNLLRARKRSQGLTIVADLRTIDQAVDQYSIEYAKAYQSPVPVAAWKIYIKPGNRLYTTDASVFGGIYGDQQTGVLPNVPSTDWDALIEVCNSSFWSPYMRGN